MNTKSPYRIVEGFVGQDVKLAKNGRATFSVCVDSAKSVWVPVFGDSVLPGISFIKKGDYVVLAGKHTVDQAGKGMLGDLRCILVHQPKINHPVRQPGTEPGPAFEKQEVPAANQQLEMLK